MILKRSISVALAAVGYEVRKRQPAQANIAELKGLRFSDFLDCYLRGRNIRDLFVIQVGAHNGVSNDVLHDIALKFGLSGVLMEPQISCFRELQTTYSTCAALKLENAALSHEDGERKLYTIRKDLPFLQYANQAASFNYDHIRHQLRKHLKYGAKEHVLRELSARGLSVDECIEAETVKSISFGSLLEKYGVRSYDLLQVDTEGFDYEVIKLAKVDQYRPLLINYEHEHLKARDRDACWTYLAGLGYKLFTHEGDTAAYLLD
jgi:FkbM family methyltransferase